MSSATGRGAERQPLDHYATPRWAVEAILPELEGHGGRPPATVMEPACGAGSILDVLRERWPSSRVTAVELDPERATVALDRGHPVRVGDFLGSGLPEAEEWSLVIGNPPYALAEPFVRRALDVGREVAFLLRLGFLGSAGRAELMRSTRPDVYVLPRRPAFICSARCKSCDSRWTTPAAESRPRSCPVCASSELAISTTDASEYAWFVWGPRSSGRWEILELPSEATVDD